MRTTSSFAPGPVTLGELILHHIATAAASRCARTACKVRRHRPSMVQGRALQTLGHAIEYLVDSRMHRDRGLSPFADSEAEQLLMRLSREVFAECAVVAHAGGLASWLVNVLMPGRGTRPIMDR